MKLISPREACDNNAETPRDKNLSPRIGKCVFRHCQCCFYKLASPPSTLLEWPIHIDRTMLLPLHAAAIWLCLLVTHVLGAKYWIDSQSCGERYQDALAEAISIAAEIHEVLHYKEEFESSADEWFETAMAWMFGFGVKDAMADKASRKCLFDYPLSLRATYAKQPYLQ